MQLQHPLIVTTLGIVIILASFALGIGAGYFAWSSEDGGKVSTQNGIGRCVFTYAVASAHVVGDSSKSGKGNPLGINPKVSVHVRNPHAEQGVWAKVAMKCKTLSRPEIELSSGREFISPLETHDFSVEYDIGDEDWTCRDFTVRAENVSGCVSSS